MLQAVGIIVGAEVETEEVRHSLFIQRQYFFISEWSGER